MIAFVTGCYCEAQRSQFVVISVKIKERIKIFPIPWCPFALFKNNVKLDPILRQPKEFLRKPKTHDKNKISRKIRSGRLKYLGFAIL